MPKVRKEKSESNTRNIISSKQHPYSRSTRSTPKSFFGRSLSKTKDIFNYLTDITRLNLLSFLKPLFNYNMGRISGLESIKKDTPEASFDLPEYIIIDVISVMKKLGYHPDERGMCYGIAWAALLACVRQDGQAYMKRMQYLEQMDTPPLPGDDDKYLVYPFFDAVTLSMTNYTDMSGYARGIGYPGRYEVAFPGRIIGGDETGYQVPIVKHTFIAEYTPETFMQFLQQMRENNQGIPFGVMIQYTSHAISVGFDGNKWLAVDSRAHYYIETAGLLYAFVNRQKDRYIVKSGKIIAIIEIVASNEHSLCINNVPSYNALIFNAKKSVSVPLALYLALKSDDMNITTECIQTIGQQEHTPETLFDLLTCKYQYFPGFSVALEYGYSNAIAAFIKTRVVPPICSCSKIHTVQYKSR